MGDIWMLNFNILRAGALLVLIFALSTSTARPFEGKLDESGTTSRRRAYAIVQPIADKTSLHLESEGLAVLRDITSPVAPVVVIGPYRSGKSFLLNQLLGVGCDEGFGVGHTRNTQTKGVWLWGQPDIVPGADGVTTAIIYVDTEGFESTGKSDAYDDRIFALSAIISSLLVYNLPETVRESDVEKLSFAVQLAEGFYATSQGGAQQVRAPVEAPNMLWLIQRDFLEGKTVGQMVSEALSEVPNPTRNVDIAQVNKIRESLGRVVRNSTAAGLRQPHLERTRLCQLSDAELDPVYVRQRDELRTRVRQLARPKSVNGQVMTGPVLAELIETMVGALNARDIPTAGSILEHFNRELVQKLQEKLRTVRCIQVKEGYVEALEALPLPVEEAALEAVHERALGKALKAFDSESFGVAGSPDLNILRDALVLGCGREHDARRTANMLASTRACEAGEEECEAVLEREQSGTLPSTGRFKARFERCRARFGQVCIGPARPGQEERLERAQRRESARFVRDYNDRLLNGLVIASLAFILLFRFIIKSSLLETLGWLAFAFLQVYPKMFLRGGTMYDTAWWSWLVTVWEAVVYNKVLDLQQCWQIVLPVGVLAFVGLKWYNRSRRRRRQREEKHIVRQGSRQDIRDLNV